MGEGVPSRSIKHPLSLSPLLKSRMSTPVLHPFFARWAIKTKTTTKTKPKPKTKKVVKSAPWPPPHSGLLDEDTFECPRCFCVLRGDDASDRRMWITTDTYALDPNDGYDVCDDCEEAATAEAKRVCATCRADFRVHPEDPPTTKCPSCR